MQQNERKKRTISDQPDLRLMRQAQKELAAAFASLSNPKDVERAFVDFLTPAEQRDLYSRWLIFKMLEDGVTQREISQKLGVSLCKITRGSRFLKSSKTIVRRMLAASENNEGKEMKVIADDISKSIAGSSWIRRMFEAGGELRKKIGAENVFDFSLGNPDLPPPPEAKDALHAIADSLSEPRALGYPSNAGFMPFREALAEKLAKEQVVPALKASHVIVSCGAAGAITSFFRAVLNPGDEVLVPSPYFVEYGSYCGHFGGKLIPVASDPETFDIDLKAMETAITDKTRVIMFNSPNNPTGTVYSDATVTALADLINRVNEGRERPIFLLSDEPYRFLTYGGIEVAPVLSKSPFAIVLGSFSKSLSMAGERVGYLAVNPEMPDVETFLAAVTLTTRTLGFVNAPIIGQKLAMCIINSGIDLNIYTVRREKMLAVLDAAGLTYAKPQGAFYVFPKVPGGDDVKFVNHLLQYGILAVPGSGFGMPGYMRLSYSVENDVIDRSKEAFVKALSEWGLGVRD